ncbi:D-hexose-6-phosphate mutarotase [Pseudovibrio sp. Tun.PSC04-5.I4]|uniref:D-hexose-6-phosphate mutarotase n=1 Tax=Pseudovibrio sp. Tun.PSC04-5.I4 TaxID=1798213 RepID=UPI0008918848|nr:D-hexose-6-phosphate mutarotase [Pseudovibrio sp. Tun.PSC04-5.I4]SDR27977.1 glucose-6-phosphate 1-epimerase [Pseudovibrio sp. Tun.PSC04-5.I4]
MSSTSTIQTTSVNGVSFVQLKSGETREAILIENAHSKTMIALNGAHVMSFIPKGKPDLLWMSPKSELTAGTPIRGGIPLCLPWFGPGIAENQPMHGFARVVDWAVASVKQTEDGATKIVLVLADSPKSHEVWPVAFASQLEITAGTQLTMKLSFQNKSNNTQRLEFAFHTYFNIGDTNKVSIEGLEGCHGIDRMNDDSLINVEGPLELEGATTRFFSGIPEHLFLNSPMGQISISGDQKSCMVWNPGEAAAKVADIGAGAEANFVCVERVDAMDTAITLKPSATYTASMAIGWS